jgi:hypothetical protein
VAGSARGAVGTNQLGDASVTTSKIGVGQVTDGHIFPGAIGAAAVADESLTLQDLVGSQANIGVLPSIFPANGCADFRFTPALGAQPGQNPPRQLGRAPHPWGSPSKER